MKNIGKKYLGILIYLFYGLIMALYSHSAISQINSSQPSLDQYITKKKDVADKLIVVVVDNPEQEKDIGFERDGERTYTSDDLDYPFELKCSKYDYRTIHFCPKISFFSPSARVYFDSGDADNKFDMFNDGNLNAGIDFVSIYVPFRFGRSAFYDSISWGPALGVGISAPAKSSDTDKASGAPVVLASVGFQFEYALGSNGSSCSFEIGRAIGFSSDESLKKSSDQATYVGLKIKISTESDKK